MSKRFTIIMLGMKLLQRRFPRFNGLCLFALLSCATVTAKADVPAPMTLSENWQLQDIAKVTGTGAELSLAAFQPMAWYKATVPGTVLTSLVDDGVYPEPLYGENNRPDKIPESLCRTSYWYRTIVTVPDAYAGKKIWLNFDGINYAAEVWVNGHDLGAIKGAFIRGLFDISS
jgi:beta-galactosidase/beta-glucuronidase